MALNEELKRIAIEYGEKVFNEIYVAMEDPTKKLDGETLKVYEELKDWGLLGTYDLKAPESHELYVTMIAMQKYRHLRWQKAHPPRPKPSKLCHCVPDLEQEHPHLQMAHELGQRTFLTAEQFGHVVFLTLRLGYDALQRLAVQRITLEYPLALRGEIVTRHHQFVPCRAQRCDGSLGMVNPLGRVLQKTKVHILSDAGGQFC